MTQTNNKEQIKSVEGHYPTPQPGVDPFFHLGKDREEQIKINQAGIDLIRSWRERKLSDEEAKAAEESWEFVKKVIDENRSRKFFS